MKNLCRMLGVLFVLAGPAGAVEVRTGDSRERAVELLGRPRGRIVLGSQEVLNYPRGNVYLENGVVTTNRMLSTAEFLVAEKADASREAEAQARADAERGRLTEEGVKERDRLLEDAAYKDWSPERKLAYWKQFKQKYPGVELPEGYETALQQERKEAARQPSDTEAGTTAEPPAPRLSGSKNRKALRAGKGDRSTLPSSIPRHRLFEDK